MKQRLCIFLLQLGGPETIADIEPFLRNLFEDVFPMPRLLRRPLARWIAKRRAPKVAPLYHELGGGSPLLKNTEAQGAGLQQVLHELGFCAKVFTVMRYAPPRAQQVLDVARKEWADATWVLLPLYPQYSFATTRSSVTEIESLLSADERARLKIVTAYPDEPLYLDAMAECVRETLAQVPSELRDTCRLVFSAHGLPVKYIREGDPYCEHVERTKRGVLARLENPPAFDLCYQSRVGPIKWLEPTTDATLRRLGREGVQSAVIVPVSFVSDHIETLHELDIQLREVATLSGLRYYQRAPVVGTRTTFIRCLAQLVQNALASKVDTLSSARQVAI